MDMVNNAQTYESLRRLIPIDLWHHHVCLSQKVDVIEIAWKPFDAVEVLEVLRRNDIPVLSGDVYACMDGQIISTGDGWHMTENESESFASCRVAMNYIGRYVSDHDGDYLFTLHF